MLDRLKLRGRIVACTLIPLVFAGILGTSIWIEVRQVDELEEQIDFSQEVVRNWAEATLHAIRMERSMRGYLINRKDRHRQGFETGRESYNNAIAILEDQVENLTDPRQKERFQEYVALGKQLERIERETISLAAAGQLDEAVRLFSTDDSSELIREIQEIYEAFADREREIYEAKEADAKAALEISLAIAGWGTAIASLITFIIAIAIATNIRARIYRAVRELATSATEISVNCEQQESAAIKQATSVNQTTTSMEELTASSKATAEQAESAATSAGLVLNLVDGRLDPASFGGDRSTATDSSLKENVARIAFHIEQLSQQLRQIDEISSTVSNIASQTNMLALNASVEAVRAGEAGKGFGIVASEIRKLADRSGHSAERINSLVKDIQSASNATIHVTNEGMKTVETVVHAIDEIVGNSQQISLTAQQQAIAIQQVLEAMNVLDRISRETAGSISQAKIGTEKLNSAALNLQEMV